MVNLEAAVQASSRGRCSALSPGVRVSRDGGTASAQPGRLGFERLPRQCTTVTGWQGRPAIACPSQPPPGAATAAPGTAGRPAVRAGGTMAGRATGRGVSVTVRVRADLNGRGRGPARRLQLARRRSRTGRAFEGVTAFGPINLYRGTRRRWGAKPGKRRGYESRSGERGSHSGLVLCPGADPWAVSARRGPPEGPPLRRIGADSNPRRQARVHPGGIKTRSNKPQAFL